MAITNFQQVEELINIINSALLPSAWVDSTIDVDVDDPSFKRNAVAMKNNLGLTEFYVSSNITGAWTWVKISSSAGGAFKPQSSIAVTNVDMLLLDTVYTDLSNTAADIGKFWVVGSIDDSLVSDPSLPQNERNVTINIRTGGTFDVSLGDWIYWDGTNFINLVNIQVASYTKTEIDAFLNTIDTQISINENSIITLNSITSDLNITDSDLQSQVDTISSEVLNINSAQDASINELQNIVSNLNITDSDLQNQVDTISSEVLNINPAQDASINELQSIISTFNTADPTVNASIEELQTITTDIISELENYDSDITPLLVQKNFEQDESIISLYSIISNLVLSTGNDVDINTQLSNINASILELNEYDIIQDASIGELQTSISNIIYEISQTDSDLIGNILAKDELQDSIITTIQSDIFILNLIDSDLQNQLGTISVEVLNTNITQDVSIHGLQSIIYSDKFLNTDQSTTQTITGGALEYNATSLPVLNKNNQLPYKKYIDDAITSITSYGITRYRANPAIVSNVLTLDFNSKNELIATKSGGGGIVAAADFTIAFENESNAEFAQVFLNVTTPSSITLPTTCITASPLDLEIGKYQAVFTFDGTNTRFVISEPEITPV